MSPPYELHTRVRQEKGQDIAGACGQLALVNPGKNANIDIEDADGRTSSNGKNTKNAVKKNRLDKKNKSECSGDISTCQSTDCTSKLSNPIEKKKEISVGHSKLLCYASVIVPIMFLTALGKMKLYS